MPVTQALHGQGLAVQQDGKPAEAPDLQPGPGRPAASWPGQPMSLEAAGLTSCTRPSVATTMAAGHVPAHGSRPGMKAIPRRIATSLLRKP